MKLHENISLYRDAIRFTAQQMNLKPEYVEKDYWVTYALVVAPQGNDQPEFEKIEK